MPKILHLLSSNRFSGAENVACQIIKMFQNEPDMEMAYCSPDGSIKEALAEREVEFFPLQKMSVKEVKNAIRQWKPDIIHAHDMRASFIAALSCGKKPLVSHIHNNNFDSRGLSLKSILYFFAAKKAKHIFWVSQSAFHGYFFGKRFSNKSDVLYNVIDIDALKQKKDADSNQYDFDIVFVGRLTYPKDPERLMRVFRMIADQAPDVKIAVAGTGDMEAQTKAFCTQLNLDSNVVFTGFMSNPYKLLSDAKVMVLTSRWEGTPMVALEALALGTPIVSTPTDGMCELIQDGRNGYLSQSNDILAEQIVAIVKNPVLYQELSKQAESMAKKMNDVEPYRYALKCVYKRN